MAIITQQFLVSGVVQGVSFRHFTCKKALEMNIKGWVRNLKDGRVEVLAEGGAEALKNFREFIAQGPTAAKVENVLVTRREGLLGFNNFEIECDGESPC